MINNKFKLIIICSFPILLLGCKLFEYPEGKAEIVSVYTTDSGTAHYLTVEIKVSNESTKNIYYSNINLEAKSSKRSYYSTCTSSLSILPGKSIYLSKDFSFTEQEEEENEITESSDTDSPETTKTEESDDEEKWLTDSVTILEEFYN